MQYKLLYGDAEELVIKRRLIDLEGDLETAVAIENVIMVLFFFASTVFTTITSLNMLIAMLNQTFERHIDDLHLLAIK